MTDEAPRSFVVLVCGGRGFQDMPAVAKALGDLHASRPITCIIEGGAPGADRCAWRWAQDEGIGLMRYEADWARHGKAAGPIRNAKMLADSAPDMVVAFPGGRGTANMVALATAAGVQVWQPLTPTPIQEGEDEHS